MTKPPYRTRSSAFSHVSSWLRASRYPVVLTNVPVGRRAALDIRTSSDRIPHSAARCDQASGFPARPVTQRFLRQSGKAERALAAKGREVLNS